MGQSGRWTECGEWTRRVTQHTGHPNFPTIQTAESLDMDKAVERLWEAMRERPDASLRDWLDHAIYGGDE